MITEASQQKLLIDLRDHESARASLVCGLTVMDTETMFDQKTQAEAMVLEDLGSGNTVTRDMHGVDWDHHKYILEVRPAGEDPFRIETKAKVPIFSAPQPGDLVKVTYEHKSHKTEIQVEGDPRYDPKIIRENKKQQKAAREQALLSGAPVPARTGVVHHVGRELAEDEPRWVVPAICPECGARVDQSAASTAEHPKCEYCARLLPCQPVV